MNRKQRRLFNKTNKTNFTKAEFEAMLNLERIKSGNFGFEKIELPKDREYKHYDNEELAPEGIEVKLNFDSLEFRRNHVDATNKAFCDWIGEAKKEPDKIYHLTREGARSSLVCLKEDQRTIEIDGKRVDAPKWLFDLYADLLFEYKGKWVSLGEVDDNLFKDYIVLKENKNNEEKAIEKENK